MNPTKLAALLFLATYLCACDKLPWNMPYSRAVQQDNILYSAFDSQPKHLDPAISYASNEYVFIAQIYEPPLQYHYLKRPYQLVPLTAVEVPHPAYISASGQRLPDDAPAKDIAYSVYTIAIKPNIQYQNHPAFAKDEQGNYDYHQLQEEDLRDKHTLADFPQQATRELIAADYVYQIKRLASPQVNSPIRGLMQNMIVGLKELSEQIKNSQKGVQDLQAKFIDLRQFPLAGVKIIDRYRYQIKIKGKDPQFVYWLSMLFFAPMPWEADRFYHQAGMLEKNITFDWYPIGTGPYRLAVNNPNREMRLLRNENFHGELFPTSGEQEDIDNGILQDAGKPIPFTDQIVFSLEKETIPRWNKFLQGYYDTSGISSDIFDVAVSVSLDGEVALSDTLREKGIRLRTSVSAGTFYFGFNMLDSVVGGYGERARKLRQAISIAVDVEEFISIFMNGRGIAAQSLLPPGIFGYQDTQQAYNTVIYQRDGDGIKRKSLDKAKQLLIEAGYRDGRDIKTGNPLIINYDAISAGGPDDKARFAWLVKQFAKLDIQLNIRSTDYNRFQDKMRNGHAQIFFWGWHADYPDPENFLFLLYGPNTKVKNQGENASNYVNHTYDALYEKMKDMENTKARKVIIDKMIKIVQNDAPWIWGFHPKVFSLSHSWNRIGKPNDLANNTMKYAHLDPHQRMLERREWNKPILWPLGLIALLMVGGVVPVGLGYWRKEHQTKKKRLPPAEDSNHV